MTHVEIDEVLGLVGHVGAEVTAHNTMPSWVILLVEFLLDVRSNVLLDVELLKGNISTVDSILLHLLVHVGMLDDGFPFGGGHKSLNKLNAKQIKYSTLIFYLFYASPSSFRYGNIRYKMYIQSIFAQFCKFFIYLNN